MWVETFATSAGNRGCPLIWGQLNTGFIVVITGNYVKRIKVELPKTTNNLLITITFKEIHQ